MERQDFLNPAKNPFFDHAEVRLFLARDASGAHRRAHRGES